METGLYFQQKIFDKILAYNNQLIFFDEKNRMKIKYLINGMKINDFIYQLNSYKSTVNMYKNDIKKNKTIEFGIKDIENEEIKKLNDLIEKKFKLKCFNVCPDGYCLFRIFENILNNNGIKDAPYYKIYFELLVYQIRKLYELCITATKLDEQTYLYDIIKKKIEQQSVQGKYFDIVTFCEYYKINIVVYSENKGKFNISYYFPLIQYQDFDNFEKYFEKYEKELNNKKYHKIFLYQHKNSGHYIGIKENNNINYIKKNNNTDEKKENE